MCTYVYVCVYVYDIYTYTQIDKCRRIYIQIDRRRQTYRPPIDRSLTDKHRHKHRHTDRQTVRHIQTSTDKQTRKHANSYKQKWYLTAAPTGGNNLPICRSSRIWLRLLQHPRKCYRSWTSCNSPAKSENASTNTV